MVERAVGVAAGEVAREGVVASEVEVQGRCAVAEGDERRGERSCGVAAAVGAEIQRGVVR